jgi:hypothetical protein
MHASVLEFCKKVIHPDEVQGKTILEVGSAFVNGSVRPQIEAMKPARYVGIDLAPGPGVDVVCPVEHLPADVDADLVVSCEMLEHAQDWKAAFRRMADAARSTLVLTARGPGFPYHNPPDHWRFVPSDLWRASLLCGLWPVYVGWDPQVPGVFLKAERRDVRPLIADSSCGLGDLPDVFPSPDPARRVRR